MKSTICARETASTSTSWNWHWTHAAMEVWINTSAWGQSSVADRGTYKTCLTFVCYLDTLAIVRICPIRCISSNSSSCPYWIIHCLKPFYIHDENEMLFCLFVIKNIQINDQIDIVNTEYTYYLSIVRYYWQCIYGSSKRTLIKFQWFVN